MSDFTVTVVESPALEVIVELAGAGSSAGVSSYNDLTDVPATFPPETHTHAYADITGKPTTFAPSTHATSHQPGGADAMAVDAAAATGSLRTLGTGATQAAAGDHTHASSGYTPAWVKTGAAVAYAAFASGDPSVFAWLPLLGSLSGQRVRPDVLTTTRVMLVKFRLPKAHSVTAVRAFPIGTTTGLFNFGIYQMDGTRLWTSGAFNTTAGTWLNLTANTPFSISANTDYWFGITCTNGATTTITFDGLPAYNSTEFWDVGGGASPISGLGAGMPELAQASTTSGTMPSPLGTVVDITTAGAVPPALLVGTAS